MDKDTFRTLLKGLIGLLLLVVGGLIVLAVLERDIPELLGYVVTSLLGLLSGLFIKNPSLTPDVQEVEVVNSATEPIPVIPPGEESLDDVLKADAETTERVRSVQCRSKHLMGERTHYCRRDKGHTGRHKSEYNLVWGKP